MADPAALATGSASGRAAATACAPASGSSARTRWSRCCSAATATTRGTPTGWSGRCSRRSTTASASRGAPPWPPTSATASTATRRAPAQPPLLRRPPAGRPLRVVRRAAAAAGHRLARGPRHRRRRWPLDDDLRWQAELWRRLLAAGRRDPPDVRHARVAGAAPRRRRRARPARPALAVRAHPAAGHRDRAARRRSPSSATSTCGCRSPRPRCGTTSPASAAWSRATTTRSAELVAPPAAGLARPRRPRAAAHARRVPSRSASTAGRRRRARPPCSAGCSTTCAPTTRRRVEERAGRGSATDDRSLQVHACHGAARQVDVLREVLVGLLEDDPTLEPRDILVMCPDIETYAPLISAGFGLADVVEDADGGGHPAHRLRVRLADRALTSTNPLLAVAAALVELAGGRVTATDVLDLARHEAVPAAVRVRRRRPRPGRPAGWHESGIRWGLDADRARRSRWTASTHNTWRSGLDRILLGVAMSGDDHRHLGRGLPVDDVGERRHRPGRPARRALDRLARLSGRADRGRAPSGEWVTALRDGVRSLTDVPADDAWQLPQFERELARAVVSAGERRRRTAAAGRRPRAARSRGSAAGRPAPTSAPAPSPSARWCRCGRCRTGSSAWSGSTTGCSRAPRRSTATTCWPGDPLTGERDLRSEDRQLLLDAILAATRDAGDHLHRRRRAHRRARGRPRCRSASSSTPLDRTTADAGARPGAASATRCSPTTPATSPPGRLLGDAAVQLRPRRARRCDAAAGPRDPAASVARRTAAAAPADDVSLADLKAFLAHPVRAFLRGRLDVARRSSADEVERRDPGRPRRARGVAGRRPAAARGAGRRGPGRGDDGRAAARHAASRRPRRAAR